MTTTRIAGAAAGPLVQPRLGGPVVPSQGTPNEAGLASLRAIAGAGRVHWTAGADIATARNAHRTNTVPELRDALAGDSTWLEGDVRMHAGIAVMAHDADHGARALALRDWVEIGAASGRGLKLDFKDARAVDDALRTLRAADVPGHRIIFNVAASGSANGRARVPLEQLRRIRATFPDAIINLDPGRPPYDAKSLDRVTRLAKQLGGRIMFPLDARAVSADVVRTLRRHGRVAVWNDPRTFDPGDVTAATRRLRALGVDGMIDLRPGASAARRGGTR